MRRASQQAITAITAVTAVLGLLLGGALQAADPAIGPSRVASRVPQPVIEPARGAQCVDDPAYMRRNHMDLLKHDRDDTVRAGMRDTRYSLKACINCHASKATNSVNAAGSNFCQSCHSYAAVKIDCFECHASNPAPDPAHGVAKP